MYSNKVFKVPRISGIRTISSTDIPTAALEPDEVYYDYNTMTYHTKSSIEKIRELESQLKIKQEDKKKSLKNIIGYFYRK